MSAILEAVEVATQGASSTATLAAAYAAWKRQRNGEHPSVVAVQTQGEARSATPSSRSISLAARLTGDSARYAEEWAAEWHDLPRRPRRIRAMYLARISTRAIPIGVIAWSRKRRKA
ncbi:hypothetical protein [Streptomyces sp. NPDC093089]|uniref:effector-associated constant component EACC1 n=1 Tax=Streptomyces sp. NPDC093089 TaxID=3366024 RepID=UPI00380C287B